MTTRTRLTTRCPRCRGNGTLYNTDGKLTLCPSCLGAGEIEARASEAVADDYAFAVGLAGDLGGAVI